RLLWRRALFLTAAWQRQCGRLSQRSGDCAIGTSGAAIARTDGMNGPAMIRTFLVFFVGGLLTAAAFFSLVLSGAIIWMDCLHRNPGHVCGDALMFAAITPLYGVVFAMLVGFLPLLAGAVLAVLGRAVFHRVPLWYATAILPVCVLAYALQGSPWVPYDDLR